MSFGYNNLVGHGSTLDATNYAEHWRRAVYRQPPKRFCICMLHCEKQGGEYHHGLKIIPIIDSDKASVSSFSVQEYEIWRTWEDFLWLQLALEEQYDRRSIEKRQRLLAGKGVKKNGLYKQPGAASSFESLPPGPDPHSVAKNFHQIIPKLSKRGTFFSPSQSFLNQRQNEVKNFVMALFQDDVPTLISDLRDDRLVTDFFGYWRRDYDLAVKAEKAITKAQARASSDTHSSRGSFSLNRLTPRSTDPSMRSPSPLASSVSSRFRIPLSPKRNHTSTASDAGSPRSIRSRTDSNSSSTTTRRYSSSSSGSSSSSRSSIGSISTIASTTQDVPLVFGNHSNLEPPPENDILDARGSGTLTPTDRLHTHGRNHVRESWQTTASAATYLEGIGLSLPPEAARSRISVSSVATFLTTNSADAVVPFDGMGMGTPDSPNSTDRPVSVSSTCTSQSDEVIDPYIAAAFPLPPFIMTPTPPDSRSPTPVNSLHSKLSTRASTDNLSVITARTSPAPISPAASTTSLATFVTAETSIVPKPQQPPTAPVAGSPLFIKVAHNESIVLVRAQRNVRLAEIRQRIFDKLVNQEGLSLSPSFALALVVSQTPSSKPSSPEAAQLKFISSQRDWDLATLTVHGKLNLRVLDTLSN